LRDRLPRARANPLPVPVIDDQDELVVHRRLREGDAVELVLRRMRSVEEIDVELPD
jgi:hypothetical protein